MATPLVEGLAVARFAADETLRVLPVFLLSVGLGGLIRQLEMVAAVWGTARPRVFALYVGVALVGAMAAGLVTSAVLG